MAIDDGAQLTRRGFLKTTALIAGAASAAGTGALSLSRLAEADQADSGVEEIFTVACCGNCGGRDALECHVRDGAVVDICNLRKPERNRENICQRGLSNMYRIHGERRLQYPMRRVGERGENKFERISWDEAITEICEKWKGYQREYGPNSVVFAAGSGSARCDSNCESGYMYRLVSYMNATKMVQDQDAVCMTALSEMIGGGLTAWGNDWCTLSSAEQIVAWGCNVTEQAVVRARHVLQAQANGVPLKVIDPICTITAAKADQYIPIRAASDGLLLIGMMRYVLRNGLQHNDFLRDNTVAPLLVKDSDGFYVRLSDLGRAQAGTEQDALVVVNGDGAVGVLNEMKDCVITGVREVEGIAVHTAYDLLVDRVLNSEWTDEQICEYTTVDQETIDDLAHSFATKATTCCIAYGPNHYTNGQTFYYNFIAMMMLTGNWCSPGRGIVGGDISFQFAVGGDISKYCFPEDAPGISYTFYNNQLEELLAEGHIGTDEPCAVKSLFLPASNYLGSQPHRNKLIELFEKIDFIVVQEIEANDTTKYADIILPACHWWESWGFDTGEGYVHISEKIFEPMYESKSDVDIYNLLLAGMGFSDKVIETEDLFTGAFEDNALGISWDRLKKEKLIKALPEGYVPCNGAGGSFTTSTGRAQFYRENAMPVPYYGQEWDTVRENLPYWEPPTEAWFESEAARKYPVHFITERAKFKIHSIFSYVPNLLEIAAEPVLQINPEDAATRDIEDGDVVRVYNDRGYVVLKTALNNAIRPGMCLMDHGWQDEQFIEGHYQSLTGLHTGITHANSCYNDTMVQIEKA